MSNCDVSGSRYTEGCSVWFLCGEEWRVPHLVQSLKAGGDAARVTLVALERSLSF